MSRGSSQQKPASILEAFGLKGQELEVLLFLTGNLLCSGGLFLLLGGGVGFDLLLCCLLVYGLR